jgi:hypothetical protein
VKFVPLWTTLESSNSPRVGNCAHNRADASTAWAARLLRNLLAHDALPKASYFMLALPDVFYLWKDPHGTPPADRGYIPDGIEPDYEIAAVQALAPYMDGAPSQLADMSEPGLELLVASWLVDLLNTDLSRGDVSPELRVLFDSGLYEAIKEGRLATEALL